MDGAHEHPDMAVVVAGLLERVDALEQSLAALSGKVRGHREYTGKIEERVEFPCDNEWRAVPGFPAFTGSAFTEPDETHSLYLRIYPVWPEEASAPLIVEARYQRAGGDATAHDMKQYAPATRSIPFRAFHDEFGEQDVGGIWQLRCSGGPKVVELTTRYGKLRAFDTDWV